MGKDTHQKRASEAFRAAAGTPASTDMPSIEEEIQSKRQTYLENAVINKSSNFAGLIGKHGFETQSDLDELTPEEKRKKELFESLIMRSLLEGIERINKELKKLQDYIRLLKKQEENLKKKIAENLEKINEINARQNTVRAYLEENGYFKRDENGTLELEEARLLLKAYEQRTGHQLTDNDAQDAAIQEQLEYEQKHKKTLSQQNQTNLGKVKELDKKISEAEKRKKELQERRDKIMVSTGMTDAEKQEACDELIRDMQEREPIEGTFLEIATIDDTPSRIVKNALVEELDNTTVADTNRDGVVSQLENMSLSSIFDQNVLSESEPKGSPKQTAQTIDTSPRNNAPQTGKP